MLLRFLLFILFGYLIVSALKSYLMGRKIDRPSSRRGAVGDAEPMVFDPQCQSYVPKGEAIQQGENYFCSRECAKLFLSR
ncbi:MAG TPA: PP0621 family protein [Candidatus Acidoferrales bacterium]|nr:PP0621 family protein [Candidatus Acidoferrales bacterium]